jgi:tetratricopeptide (TPR) repeat protein
MTATIRLLKALLLLLLVGAASAATAAPATAPAAPGLQLVSRDRGVDSDATRSKALKLARLDIAVTIHGRVADTVLTARFDNPGEDELEGDFILALPRNSVVTGYALDIDGAMVDGVLADQRQARLAYQARVRRGVDPGLAEVSRAFEFRTRVFPIRPGTGRIVRLRFTSPIEANGSFVLPLGGGVEVGTLSLTVAASGLAGRPDIVLPDAGTATLQQNDGSWRLSYEKSGVTLRGPLAISTAAEAGAMIVTEGRDGERYFDIADYAPAAAPAPAAQPGGTVAILWDGSWSRADDDLAAEIALVAAFLKQSQPRMVDLILFDSGGVERVSLAPAAVPTRLRAVRYGGATSFAVLGKLAISAKTCLLFSDGLATIDRRGSLRPRCPVFAVSSAPNADRAWLSALAGGTGGQALRLGGGNGATVAEQLAHPGARVLSVRSAAGAPIAFHPLDTGKAGWRIVGPLPKSGGIVLSIADAAGGATDRVYLPPQEQAPVMGGAGALWAAQELALRTAQDDADPPALIDFARRQSVAGPEISFVVLETASDYAAAGIAPAATAPAEQRAEYEELAAESREEKATQKRERLGNVLEAWQEQKRWWATRFNPGARVRRPKDEDGGLAPMVMAPPVAEEGVLSLRSTRDAANASDSIVVTGSRVAPPPVSNGQSPADEPVNTSRVELAEWAPKRPYLTALRAAPPGGLPRVLAEQQAVHGALPAFWLDVSEYYYRAGNRPEALRLLLSALELPTRNSDTVAIVADRLTRWGELDRAIALYEQLAAAEPDRPQPMRNLALALGRRAARAPAVQARADYARAISLLTDLIMTPWSGDYDGIEMVSLMEVNSMIARYRRLGGGAVALDPRLIALLDVDLRIVVEWNSESTDLDLWVDEPSRERAFYGNQRTLIGGHMSDDMTAGYGPEEYLLRRAPVGTYTIRADTYASDALDPNGASRITTRIIRDFGRATEREDIVDVELVPGDEEEDEKLIGRIRIDRARPAGSGAARGRAGKGSGALSTR